METARIYARLVAAHPGLAGVARRRALKEMARGGEGAEGWGMLAVLCDAAEEGDREAVASLVRDQKQESQP